MLRRTLSLGNLSFCVAIAAAALTRPATAEASSPFLVIPNPAVAEATPAYKYANMSDDDALAELDRRKILYHKAGPVPGVRAPIRLTGRLHGVYFHSSLSPDERVHSLFEVLDARLALALDDFAAVLARHDIDEVVHFTMYRPNVGGPEHGVDDEPAIAAASRHNARHGTTALRRPGGRAPATNPAASPKGQTLDAKAQREDPKSARGRAHPKRQKGEPDTTKKREIVTASAPSPRAAGARPRPASKSPPSPPQGHGKTPARVEKTPAVAQASIPLHRTTWAAPGTRHPAGLAIDVGGLHKRDGRWLSIGSHFHGSVGERTCGAGARIPEEPEARELRSIVCEASDLGIFTYVLTPNYNAAHVDHYHMEIKPGVRWFLYNCVPRPAPARGRLLKSSFRPRRVVFYATGGALRPI